MKITWIGQSGYVLTDGKTTICIDPYLSDAVNRVAGRARMVDAPFEPQELNADAVICTHNHLDHVDADAIPLMKKDRMTFYAPSDCRDIMAELRVKNYIAFDKGAVAQIGDFTIEAVFAAHTVPAIGVVVTYTGKRLYFTGDTYYHENLKEIPCDCLFVCINGKLGNMDVNDAIKLTREINPMTAIPNHYGMFKSNTENPEKFDVPQRFIMQFNKEYDLKELA